MENESRSHEIQEAAKVFQRATEIKENTPGTQLSGIISELEQYMKLRTLYEKSYKDLPDDLREEIGTRDPMDEFFERVADFEPWDVMSDTYGFASGGSSPQWSIDELEQLVHQLKG